MRHPPVGSADPATHALADMMQGPLFIVKESDNAGVPLPAIEVPSCEQFEHLLEEVIGDGIMVAWAERTGMDLTTGADLKLAAKHPLGTSSSYPLRRPYETADVIIKFNTDLLKTLIRHRYFYRSRSSGWISKRWGCRLVTAAAHRG